MSVIRVSAMIAALDGVNNAIIPGQPDRRLTTSNFELRPLWAPGVGNPGTDPGDHLNDGHDPLDGILVSRLDDGELGEAIQRSPLIRSPWGSPEEDGIDALAWYVSFHRDPQNWGIYIPISGLLRFANNISPSGPGPSGWEGVVNLALRGLLAHERIHFAVDYAAGQVELLFNAPCYIQARAALSNGRYVPDEEKLANGACLRSIRWKPANLNVPDAYKAALAFTLKQPDGYREGGGCVVTRDFLDLANRFVGEVAAQLPGPVKPLIANPVDYTKLLPLGPLVEYRGRASRMSTVDGSQCPVFLIHDESVLSIPFGSIFFITQITEIIHSRRFERDLKRIGMYDEWDEVKSILADPWKPNSRVHFKPWPPDDKPGIKGWSTSVGRGNSNIRAHIHQHLDTGEWIAERIDDANALKHH